MNRWGVGFLVVLLLFLSEKVASAQPEKGDIELYLSTIFPQELSVKKFRYKNFPSVEKGSGRTSVAGTIFVVQETYVDGTNEFLRELKKRGFTQKNVSKVYKVEKFRRKMDRIFKPVLNIGSELDFDGELLYIEKLNGFEFEKLSLKYKYSRGIRRNNIPDIAIIVGSKEFQTLISELTSYIENPPREYTALPSRKTLGYMAPFVLRPGYETPPIEDYAGTCLRWEIFDNDEEALVVYSKSGRNGPWMEGLQNGAWFVRFVLPRAAKKNVRIEVERRMLSVGCLN